MLLNIDKKTNLMVDIGDKKPTEELIQKLRKRYNVGKMTFNLETTTVEKFNNRLRNDTANRKTNGDS